MLNINLISNNIDWWSDNLPKISSTDEIVGLLGDFEIDSNNLDRLTIIKQDNWEYILSIDNFYHWVINWDEWESILLEAFNNRFNQEVRLLQSIVQNDLSNLAHEVNYDFIDNFSDDQLIDFYNDVFWNPRSINIARYQSGKRLVERFLWSSDKSKFNNFLNNLWVNKVKFLIQESLLSEWNFLNEYYNNYKNPNLLYTANIDWINNNSDRKKLICILCSLQKLHPWVYNNFSDIISFTYPDDWYNWLIKDTRDFLRLNARARTLMTELWLDLTTLERYWLVWVMNEMLQTWNLSANEINTYWWIWKILMIWASLWWAYKFFTMKDFPWWFFWKLGLLIWWDFLLRYSTWKSTFDYVSWLMNWWIWIRNRDLSWLSLSDNNKETIWYPLFTNMLLWDFKKSEIKKYLSSNSWSISFDINKFYNSLPDNDWKRVIIDKHWKEVVSEIVLSWLQTFWVNSDNYNDKLSSDQKFSTFFDNYISQFSNPSNSSTLSNQDNSNSSNTTSSWNSSSSWATWSNYVNTEVDHSVLNSPNDDDSLNTHHVQWNLPIPDDNISSENVDDELIPGSSQYEASLELTPISALSLPEGEEFIDLSISPMIVDDYEQLISIWFQISYPIEFMEFEWQKRFIWNDLNWRIIYTAAIDFNESYLDNNIIEILSDDWINIRIKYLNKLLEELLLTNDKFEEANLIASDLREKFILNNSLEEAHSFLDKKFDRIFRLYPILTSRYSSYNSRNKTLNWWWRNSNRLSLNPFFDSNIRNEETLWSIVFELNSIIRNNSRNYNIDSLTGIIMSQWLNYNWVSIDVDIISDVVEALLSRTADWWDIADKLWLDNTELQEIRLLINEVELKWIESKLSIENDIRDKLSSEWMSDEEIDEKINNDILIIEKAFKTHYLWLSISNLVISNYIKYNSWTWFFNNGEYKWDNPYVSIYWDKNWFWRFNFKESTRDSILFFSKEAAIFVATIPIWWLVFNSVRWWYTWYRAYSLAWWISNAAWRLSWFQRMSRARSLAGNNLMMPSSLLWRSSLYATELIAWWSSFYLSYELFSSILNDREFNYSLDENVKHILFFWIFRAFQSLRATPTINWKPNPIHITSSTSTLRSSAVISWSLLTEAWIITTFNSVMWDWEFTEEEFLKWLILVTLFRFLNKWDRGDIINVIKWPNWNVRAWFWNWSPDIRTTTSHTVLSQSNWRNYIVEIAPNWTIISVRNDAWRLLSWNAKNWWIRNNIENIRRERPDVRMSTNINSANASPDNVSDIARQIYSNRRTQISMLKEMQPWEYLIWNNLRLNKLNDWKFLLIDWTWGRFLFENHLMLVNKANLSAVNYFNLSKNLFDNSINNYLNTLGSKRININWENYSLQKIWNERMFVNLRDNSTIDATTFIRANSDYIMNNIVSQSQRLLRRSPDFFRSRIDNPEIQNVAVRSFWEVAKDRTYWRLLTEFNTAMSHPRNRDKFLSLLNMSITWNASWWKIKALSSYLLLSWLHHWSSAWIDAQNDQWEYSMSFVDRLRDISIYWEDSLLNNPNAAVETLIINHFRLFWAILVSWYEWYNIYDEYNNPSSEETLLWF